MVSSLPKYLLLGHSHTYRQTSFVGSQRRGRIRLEEVKQNKKPVSPTTGICMSSYQHE